MTGEVIKHLSDEQVNALGFAPDVTLAMQANLAVMRTLQEEIAILQKRLMERVQLLSSPPDCASSAGRPRTNARTPTLSRADSATASALWLPPDSALSLSLTSLCKVPQHTSLRYATEPPASASEYPMPGLPGSYARRRHNVEPRRAFYFGVLLSRVGHGLGLRTLWRPKFFLGRSTNSAAYADNTPTRPSCVVQNFSTAVIMQDDRTLHKKCSSKTRALAEFCSLRNSCLNADF
ncbi:hypothetical protein B0G80_4622 [Paraburkholderia sp. BL6669N2]|nr:hypothetical protein B0G80_4622 [Paraburkholderia sp. BL6669N2]